MYINLKEIDGKIVVIHIIQTTVKLGYSEVLGTDGFTLLNL